jgi:hypothetical protein
MSRLVGYFLFAEAWGEKATVAASEDFFLFFHLMPFLLNIRKILMK